MTGDLCGCGDYITRANAWTHRSCSRIADIESDRRGSR